MELLGLTKVMPKSILILIMFCSLGRSQSPNPIVAVPKCVIPFTFTATGMFFPSSLGFDNRQMQCTNWNITYSNFGYTVVSLTVQSAPLGSASTAGTWVSFAGTLVSGINPNTAITQAQTTFSGYYPFIRVTAILTGSGRLTGTLIGTLPLAAQGGSPPTSIGTGTFPVVQLISGVPSLATSAGVVGLFSTCSGIQYLGADGACHTPAGATNPGAPDLSLQYNNGGAFGGVSGTSVKSNGMVDSLQGMSTPFGGTGIMQNFLTFSSCFDCGIWTNTNITINGPTIIGPNGAEYSDNDLTSTVNGALVSQAYNSGSSVGARTFTLSVWLRVPTTPVTSLLQIVSETPTTCGSGTASVTTSWQRFSLTCTFGADAGTQVIANITPVNGGQGLVYAVGAQLSETSMELPYCGTTQLPITTSGIVGTCISQDTNGNNSVGKIVTSIGGSNRFTNAFSTAAAAFGVGNTLGGQGVNYAFGQFLSVPNNNAILMGRGQSFSAPCVGTSADAVEICTGGTIPSISFIGGGGTFSAQVQTTGLVVSDGSNTFQIAPGSLTNTYVVTVPPDQGTGALTNDGSGGLSWQPSGQTPCTFATLGSVLTANGQSCYCSDCTVVSSVDNTCATSGTGASVTQINSVDKCAI